jgi:hypothetical protein
MTRIRVEIDDGTGAIWVYKMNYLADIMLAAFTQAPLMSEVTLIEDDQAGIPGINMRLTLIKEEDDFTNTVSQPEMQPPIAGEASTDEFRKFAPSTESKRWGRGYLRSLWTDNAIRRQRDNGARPDKG